MAIETSVTTPIHDPPTPDGNGVVFNNLESDSRPECLRSVSIRSMLATVEGYSGLSANWNTYGANPPNSTAIHNAANVLERCDSLRLEPTKALASAEDGVAIVFLAGDNYADIECFNTGEMLAIISNRKAEPTVWTVDLCAIDATLERIREFLAK